MHRYSENLPATHSRGLIDAEGALLLSSIIIELRGAQAALETHKTYDYGLAGRQLKRINALLSLKYPLPDVEWKEIVEALMKMAMSSDEVSVPRQTALFETLAKLLSKRRDHTVLHFQWRPFWHLLQSTYLAHISSRSRGSNSVMSEHAKRLVSLIGIASRYFPASAASELATVTAPSFAHLNTHAPFNAQMMLYVFLPATTRIEDLPAGTVEYWLRIWSTVDHCAEWDAVWASIFARLASADVIRDAVYGADGQPLPSTTSGSCVFPWGTHVSFFASRLMDMLKIPVEGSSPVMKTYPYEAAALLGGVPDGPSSMTRMLVRLLTVTVPVGIGAHVGDDNAQGGEKGEGEGSVVLRPGTGDASPLGHLERLLRALSSFFYPTSSHAGKMNTFIRHLTLMVTGRVGREAGVAAAQAVLAENGLAMPTLESSVSAGEIRSGGTPPLSPAHIERFVDAVLPLCVMGLYSSARGGSSAVWETGVTLKALAALAPARVCLEIVRMASSALDSGSVNAAHQAPNALYALSILVPPLLWPVPHLAPALPDLLYAALPGVDPNDAAKTMATLSFFAAVLSVVPIVDSDDAAESGSGSGTMVLPPWHPACPAYTGVPPGAHIPEPLLTSGRVKPVPGTAGRRGLDRVPGAGRAYVSGVGDTSATAQGYRAVTVMPGAEDEPEEGSSSSSTPGPAVTDLFVSAKESLPRIGDWVCLLLDRIFRVLETREGGSKEKSGRGKKGGTDSLGSSIHTVCAALFQQLSPRLAKTAVDRVVSWVASAGALDCVQDVAALEQAAVSAMPGAALAKLVPLHLKEITAAGASDKVATWHTRLLAGAIKPAGTALLAHLPAVSTAIRTSWTHKELEVRQAGGKLLRAAIETLVSTYSTEERSAPPSAWASLSTLWQSWGQGYSWEAEQGKDKASPSAASKLVQAGLLQPGVQPSWHMPSSSERAAALELVNEFFVGPLARLDAFAVQYGPAPESAPPVFGGMAESSSSSSSFSGQASDAQATLNPAVLTSESEKLRNDVAMVLAAFRGAVYCLTDSSGPDGDDAIVCVGSAGQALVYDAAKSKAAYAVEGEQDGRKLPLRHHVALVMDRLLRCVSVHPDFSRDVKALNLCIKVAFRAVAARGPKMFKTMQGKRDMANFKRFYREPLADGRARHFSRVMWAVAASEMSHIPSSSALVYTAMGGTHGSARGYQLSRLVYHANRRQAEALYAVPRALHWGTSATARAGRLSTIGEAGDGGEAVGDGDEGLHSDEGPPVDVDADYAEGEAEAEGGSESDMASPYPTTPSSPLVTTADIRGAIPVFGRRAVAAMAVGEHPYAALLASTVRLTMHPYDSVRSKASSHVWTMMAVFSWLRRGLQTSALVRLDRLANKTVAATASARAGPLRAAADSLLRAVQDDAGTGSATRDKDVPCPTSVPSGAALGPVLLHNVVFGLVSLAFASPHGLISNWEGLERALHVLLRSSVLIRGLPIDKHGPALANFGMAVAALVEGWHVIPIPAGHPKAGQWAAVRERLLAHLLATAAPQALLPDGEVARSPLPATPGPATATLRSVLQADGSKGLSAAPLPESPLHWRYELMAGGFMGILLAPSPALPCVLALDTVGGLPPVRAQARVGGGASCASEAVWLWTLSNVLSDNVLLRMQALDVLIQLLHSHSAARAAHIGPGPGSLPRVHSLLTDTTYVSQFVASVAQNHVEKSDTAAGALETMLAMPGMRDMATPLESSRAFVEFSRTPLNGGAIGSLPHMLMFELIGTSLPEAIPLFVDALIQLGQGSAGQAGEKSPSGAGTSEGEDRTYTPSSGTGTGATSGSGKSLHDAATLRVRQATVSEAFAGFMRALSGLRAPGAGGDDGCVSFSLADASLASLAASSGLPNPSTAPSIAVRTVPAPTVVSAADLDGAMLRLLAMACPIWEGVSVDWAADWVNALRYAMRQRHPSQAPLLFRYIFASAASAVEGSGAGLDYPEDYDRTGFDVLLARVQGASAAVGQAQSSASPSGTAAAPASSFSAQVRWLSFVQALLFESFSTADGTGVSGTLPGVTSAEESASECGLHADAFVLRDRTPVPGASSVQVAEAHGGVGKAVPSRTAAMAMSRQLLPVLLRALPHPYKACREELARTVMIVLEGGWSMGTCPVQQGEIKGVAGHDGKALAVITEPVGCDWLDWAPAVVAAVLHMVSAARPPQLGSAALDESSGGSGIGSRAGEDGSVERERSKWGSRVLESALHLIHDGQGCDAPIFTPLALAATPFLLTATAHPDRDLSKLAVVVGAGTAHTLSLARPSPPAHSCPPNTPLASQVADPDALFFRRVESLLAEAQGQAQGQATGQGSAGAAPALDSLPCALDILVRVLEVYGSAVESDRRGEGEEEDAVSAGKSTGAAGVKVPIPPLPALSSAIVRAVPPAPKAGPAGSGSSGGGTQWYVRRAALHATVSIRARNLLFIGRQPDSIMLSLVEGRLDDKQIEVADEAGNTLVGFVMTMPDAQRVALARRLLTLVNCKMPKKVAAPPDNAPAASPEADAHRKWKSRQTRALRKRLAGVLGVAAVVRSSPFDVPTYLPAILASLSAHASDPAPVGPAVKECVAEFRRTHADNWEAHKAVFTEDQLSDVMNVTAGGSYFA